MLTSVSINAGVFLDAILAVTGVLPQRTIIPGEDYVLVSPNPNGATLSVNSTGGKAEFGVCFEPKLNAPFSFNGRLMAGLVDTLGNEEIEITPGKGGAGAIVKHATGTFFVEGVNPKDLTIPNLAASDNGQSIDSESAHILAAILTAKSFTMDEDAMKPQFSGVRFDGEFAWATDQQVFVIVDLPNGKSVNWFVYSGHFQKLTSFLLRNERFKMVSLPNADILIGSGYNISLPKTEVPASAFNSIKNKLLPEHVEITVTVSEILPILDRISALTRSDGNIGHYLTISLNGGTLRFSAESLIQAGTIEEAIPLGFEYGEGFPEIYVPLKNLTKCLFPHRKSEDVMFRYPKEERKPFSLKAGNITTIGMVHGK